MIIKKCDRCGCEDLEPITYHVEKYPSIDTFWVEFDVNHSVNIHLCPECTKKVIRFAISDELLYTLVYEDPSLTECINEIRGTQNEN